MKSWIAFIIVALLTVSLAAPSHAQQVPGRGFSTLVCALGVSGSGVFELGNGNIVVTITDNGVLDGLGSAGISIQHGNSGSDHLISYQDANETSQLDCGDIVLGLQ